ARTTSAARTWWWTRLPAAQDRGFLRDPQVYAQRPRAHRRPRGPTYARGHLLGERARQPSGCLLPGSSEPRDSLPRPGSPTAVGELDVERRDLLAPHSLAKTPRHLRHDGGFLEMCGRLDDGAGSRGGIRALEDPGT